MKRMNILLIEENDGGHDINDLQRRWNSAVLQPLMHADVAIRIAKDGTTELIKNRFVDQDISSIVEEISSAYVEGKL